MRGDQPRARVFTSDARREGHRMLGPGGMYIEGGGFSRYESYDNVLWLSIVSPVHMASIGQAIPLMLAFSSSFPESGGHHHD